METNRRRQSGISLLEVLAAVFVVSIGLLGVLAVIPFGAFQVSKAQHAEYASNMLANAAEEIYIREMGKPESWNVSPAPTLDGTRFIWVEPHKEEAKYQHISCIGKTFKPDKTDHPTNNWEERMRGRDDLVYTAHVDSRPDFSEQNDKIQGSGKYTWFFTFLPESGLDAVAVDVLACYNRVPEDDIQVSIPDGNISLSRGGSRLTFTNDGPVERLSQTKYVFVTWGSPTQVAGGTWCKIVFLDKSDPAKPQIIVTGNLRNIGSSVRAFIPSGVLYHKRLRSVPIR